MTTWFTHGVDRLPEIRQAISRDAGVGLTATAPAGVSVLRTTRTTTPLGNMLELATAVNRKAPILPTR